MNAALVWLDRGYQDLTKRKRYYKRINDNKKSGIPLPKTISAITKAIEEIKDAKKLIKKQTKL